MNVKEEYSPKNKDEKNITEEKNIKDEFLFYGKYFIIFSTIFSFIWLCGYFHINIIWGLIGILTYIIYHRTMHRQRQSFIFELNLSRDIRNTVESFSNLPSWVVFPDIERVEWINKIIIRLWPKVTIFLNKKIREILLKKLQKTLTGIKLKEIYFGDGAPKICGVKIYNNDDMSREEIVCDLELQYCSPAEITLVYNQLQFGIKNIEVKAKLRVEMNSLISDIPFIGTIFLTLLQTPHINYEFTDLVSIFNMPGFRSMLRETVNDVIANIMVLPNRIPIILKTDIEARKCMFHVPDGVIRINIIEAASLKAMDVRIFEKNTSDPYMIIRVGAEKFTTNVINNCLNPQWNEVFEAIVDSKECQKVELELYDKDKNNKDDFLGKASIDIQGVYDRGIADTWIPLEDITTGSVHLKLTWLDLSSDPSSFDLEEERVKTSSTIYSVGYLYILIDSAKNLYKPSVNEDPDTFVKVSIGNHKVKTPIKKRTVNPIWEFQFTFLIKSLLSSIVNFQIKDEKSKKILGNCSLNIDRFLNEPNMEGYLSLKLDNPNCSDSTIKMYVVLRAMLPKKIRSSTRAKSFAQETSPSKKVSNQKFDDLNYNYDDKIFKKNEDVIDEVFEVMKNEQLETSVNNNSYNEKDTLNNFNDLPKVRLTLRYTANKNMFIVVVHNVQNLKTDHSVYVKLSMHPKENRNNKRHTKPIRNQRNIVYDETFEFFTNKELLETSELLLNFKIERHSVIKRNISIGRTKIYLSGFNPSEIKSDWYQIDVSKNTGNSDTLSLASNQSKTHMKEN